MPDPNLPVSLEWGALLSGLGGGLALFLLGMRQLSESLGTVAGESMKNLLARLTANRFTAALAGTVVTAVVQSSSVTTVLLVGFISAGLLNLGSSIGMIIGANIGTTVTVQIIAFNIYKYGLLLIAGGFLLNIASRRQRLQELGLAVLGIGLIFFGMELMSQATGPLRQSPLFLNYLQNVRNPLLGILLGILFTAIVQSSSATTGIVIVLASQGLLSLESGIGLIFGANIGTCVTVVIAALGRPREAVQAAWIHVIFNAGGVLLWMFFIPEFAEGVRRISPTAAQADEVARLTLETPRQIANAHTLFNVGNGLLFIWFTGPLARLVDWLVPQRREKLGIQPLYLDDLYLEQPALALDNVRRELVRLAELNQGMLARALRIVIVGNRDEIAALERADDDVDRLYGSIVTYLGKLAQQNLVGAQPTELYQYIGIANQLENVGDVIVNDLLVDARKRIHQGVVVSPQTLAVLSPLHERVCWAFERARQALENGNLDAAHEANESKMQVRQLADTAASHLAKRLTAYDPKRLATFQVESGIIESLKRLNTLTRRVARAVLEVDNGPPTASSGQPTAAGAV